MAVDKANAAMLNGAIALLLKCVSLEVRDTFALFYDETSEDVFQLLSTAAKKLNLVMLDRFVPTRIQAQFTKREGLSLEDLTALSDAMAIITCLSDHVAGTPYRAALIRYGAGNDKRLAHMPGARSQFFEHAIDVDYSPIARRCDDLALAMAVGQRATIRSYLFNDSGNPTDEYTLSFSIGGLDRLPVVSTGLVESGTWGNVPGAETFIAPIEGTASGKYVLNGSFKDHVVSGSSHILLTFADGRLAEIDGSNDVLPPFRHLVETVSSTGSSEALSFAELGIGTNPAIDRLVGKPLIDEKCIGTAHIAIGANVSYGGRLNADVHEDFVTRLPTVQIDDKPILEHGIDKFATREWRESITHELPDRLSLEPPFHVRRTFTSAEVSSEFLRLRRRFGADRLCTYTVGEPATSKLLSYVYHRVPNLPVAVDTVSLARQAGIDADLLSFALTLLVRHRLLEIAYR